MSPTRIPIAVIDETEPLVAVSDKAEKRLEVEHGVAHAAQDVQKAGYADLNELKSLYRALDSALEEKTDECCQDRILFEIPVDSNHQELVAEKEWLRNVIIDMLLMQGANAGQEEEILQLKETSRCGRTRSTALRMRYNTVKGCKNHMQEGRRLLYSVIEQVNNSKEGAPSFFSACLGSQKRAGERVVPKACDSKLIRAAELILKSYILLPPRARIRLEARTIRCVDLPWLDKTRMDKDWQKKARVWEGSFKPAAGGKAERLTLAHLERTVEQIEDALIAFETIKKTLKEAFSFHSSYALQAEERTLEIRNNIFDEFYCHCVKPA
jgi:hypothetical protein